MYELFFRNRLLKQEKMWLTIKKLLAWYSYNNVRTRGVVYAADAGVCSESGDEGLVVPKGVETIVFSTHVISIITRCSLYRRTKDGSVGIITRSNGGYRSLGKCC